MKAISASRGLRFLIVSTVLPLVVILPLRAPAGSEHLVDDAGSLLELLQPRQPAEHEQERLRQEEENRKRLQENALELEHMLAEKRASLAEIGPTFAITSVDGWQSPLGPHLRAACL